MLGRGNPTKCVMKVRSVQQATDGHEKAERNISTARKSDQASGVMSLAFPPSSKSLLPYYDQKFVIVPVILSPHPARVVA